MVRILTIFVILWPCKGILPCKGLSVQGLLQCKDSLLCKGCSAVKGTCWWGFCRAKGTCCARVPPLCGTCCEALWYFAVLWYSATPSKVSGSEFLNCLLFRVFSLAQHRKIDASNARFPSNLIEIRQPHTCPQVSTSSPPRNWKSTGSIKIVCRNSTLLNVFWI
jgi:hypothetical protein